MAEYSLHNMPSVYVMETEMPISMVNDLNDYLDEYKEAQDKAQKEADDKKQSPKSKSSKSKSKTKTNEKDSKVVDADFEDVTDKKKNVDDNDKTTGTSA